MRRKIPKELFKTGVVVEVMVKMLLFHREKGSRSTNSNNNDELQTADEAD